MTPEHEDKALDLAAARLRRRGFAALRAMSLAAVGCAILPATTAGVHGDVPEKVYTYSVHHPTHGEIGTYRNSIVDSGAQVLVRNEIRVQVKVLVVVAHEEATDGRETWRNGRLIAFSGVTRENGKKTAVTGEAEGPKFVVETPQGPKEAPASVYTSNPWSRAILKAKVLLGTKSGNLYQVHTGPGEPRDVVLGEKTIPTEYFKVDGDAQYELWFDERGVAVQFTEIDKNGVITFKLVEERVQPANASAATPAPRG